MKKTLNIGVIGLGIMFCFWACGLSDVNAFLFDADKERELGEEFDQALRDSISHQFLPENHEFSIYANKLKDSIVSKINDKSWDDVLPSNVGKAKFFSVSVIDTNIANAFAVPGGYFYLYTGILETMKDESELVAVMGHEIGHVLAHHSRDRIISATATSAALNVFLGEGGAGELIGSLGAGYFLTQNGQDDELEADAYGVQFAKGVGVKPTGISTYFGNGIVDEETGKCDEAGILEGILDVFSTHPPNCERVKEANKIVSTFTIAEQAYPSNKTRYDKKVATLN